MSDRVGPLESNGSVIDKDEDIGLVEELNNYFSSVFVQEGNFNLDNSVSARCKMNDSIDINPKEINNIIKEFKVNKASGPDEVHSRFLHETVDLISVPLSIIFNRSLKFCEIPEDWKLANVVPMKLSVIQLIALKECIDENEAGVEHITPQEETLSTVQTNVLCEKEGCNKTFKSIPVMKLHQSQYHNHEKLKKKMKIDPFVEERFHCPVKDCIYYHSAYTISKYFAKLRYLKQHYLKVHSICSYPCNQCKKSFSTRAFLRAHQQYCDLDLVCSCGQTFSCVTALQTHVRRLGHEAEVLSVYAQRIKKKEKQDEAPKSHLQQPRVQSMSVKGGSTSGPLSASPILPKSQPPHLVAAIALSELAFAGLKRVPMVDVGIQTEPPQTRRLSRKSFSPFRNRESQGQKRKQTTEMETQTRLTNLKSKLKKKSSGKRVSKCHMATDTGSSNASETTTSLSQNAVFRYNESYMIGSTVGSSPSFIVYDEKEFIPGASEGELLYKNVCDRSSENPLNNSGTQTSKGVTFNVLSPDSGCLSYAGYTEDERNGKFTDTSAMISFGSREISIQVNEGLQNVLEFKEEEEPTPTMASTQFESTQVLTDEEDNLVTISPSGRISPLAPRRAPSLSSQNRSSSIETQTDHDVFLSTHADPPDYVDDTILTSTETQTDKEASFWCTSETQTCESFSDIEPYLGSTIHTQTVGDEHSSSELFPELNNFTTDMQTQTGDEYNPILVTTHTQTSTFGMK